MSDDTEIKLIFWFKLIYYSFKYILDDKYNINPNIFYRLNYYYYFFIQLQYNSKAKKLNIIIINAFIYILLNMHIDIM